MSILLDHNEEIGLQLQIAAPLGHRAKIESRVFRLFLWGMSANKPLAKSDVK
ncbi:hypothetical protein [Janthinobacterium sp. B9-8]|uniref:hypothetical protein n=1 Tax=Janthinobacterium sp. B9-8 TaxID=1236179 RepID=UPI0012E3E21C|nr:hypothetical protein [Janthinobacterium sp. B9-8]